jgi:imidazolonepropionase-like amidohydrolase
MLADVVVVQGNPAEDLAALRQVTAVFKNGERVHEADGWN